LGASSRWARLCVRCGLPIKPGEPWHLDHDDIDRTRYFGPEPATQQRLR
jgi:hypothetical protein